MARLSGALRDHPSRDRRASLSAQAVEIARGLGDPATLAYALDGQYSAMMWPETSEQLLAIADEIVALAQEVGDEERATAGRLYRVNSNMELGRMTEAAEELEIVAEEAAALRQPAQLWMSTASRANLALFQGRFDDARPLIEKAATLGERAQRRDSVLSHRLQRFVLDRETGGDPEIEAMIDDAVCEFPTRPVFRCALAYIHSHRGSESRAQATIDDLASQDFAAIQRDNEYLFSLAFLADAVDALGDVRAAAVLYDLLVPYAPQTSSTQTRSEPVPCRGHLGFWPRRCPAGTTRPATLRTRLRTTQQWDPGRGRLTHSTTTRACSSHGICQATAIGPTNCSPTPCEEYERLGMTRWITRAAELSAAV